MESVIKENSYTRPVHPASRVGVESDARLATRPAVLRGREFSKQNIQNYDFQAPLRGEWGAGKGREKGVGDRVQGTEKLVKPKIQEVKDSQNVSNVDRAKTAVNTRETINIEHKKYPDQAPLRLTATEGRVQKLVDIFEVTQPLVLAKRPGVLAIRDALKEGVGDRVQGTENTAFENLNILSKTNLDISRFAQNSNDIQLDKKTSLRAISEAISEIKPKLASQQVQLDRKLDSGVAVLPRMTELAPTLQALPKLTIEANQALQQARETVRILAPEIASLPVYPELSRGARNDVLNGLRIITGAEARAALMTGETAQMQRTFAAQSEEFDPEQAQLMLAQAIKTRTKTMTLPEQALVLEEMIKTGQTEGFRDDPELILKIIATKEITEEIIEAQVYEPAMRARLANLETAADELAQENDEATGAEFVARLGAESNAERSPIAPDGKTDGGYDIGKAKTAALGRRKIQSLFEAARANILANPAAEYVKKVVTRKATDEEVHNIKFAQQDLDQIIRFAFARGRQMLRKMVPVLQA